MSAIESGNRSYKRFLNRADEIRHTNDWFVKQCNYLGADYELLTEYHSLQSKVTFYHKVCGHYWTVNPDAVVYKHVKCSWCRNHRGLPKLKRFCKKHDLEILTPWAKHHGIMKFKSKKCGHIFTRRVGYLYKNPNCPYCNGYRQRQKPGRLEKEIYEWRHKKGFTQAETAELFHVSPKTVSYLERGYVKETEEQTRLFKYYMNSLA